MDFATDRNTPNTHLQEKRRPPYRNSLFKALVALFGAPVAWVVQMSLSLPVAAYACYPHQVPLSFPVWAELPAILAGISLVCLGLGSSSGYIAWMFWRQSSGTNMAGQSANASRLAVPDGGQNRFLAMIGLMSSALFILAILFTCFAVFLVSPCTAWT